MIVVIGSKGYLGSKVTKILKKTFVNVIEYEKIIKFKKLIYPSYVIYLKRPKKDIKNFKTILKKFLSQNPKLKFLYISSLSVYGLGATDKIINLNSKFNPLSEYGLAKIKEETYLNKIKLVYNKLQIIIIRCPTIYSNHHDNQHKIFNFLLKWNIPLPLNIPFNKRSYLLLENFLDFIVHIIKNNTKYNEFLICEKKNLSTSSIVKNFKKINKSNSKLFHVNYRLLQLIFFILKKEHLVKKMYGNFQINPYLSFKRSKWLPKKTKANV